MPCAGQAPEDLPGSPIAGLANVTHDRPGLRVTPFDVLRPLVELAGPRDAPKTVVDGGFHRGGFTRQVLQAWPASRVVGFEPDPEICRAGAPFAAAHETVDLRECALGAEPGRAAFHRGEMAATNSLLPRPDAGGRPYFPARARLTDRAEVSVVALDDVLAETGIDRLDLLKLDLQGGELAALQGARRALEAERIGVVLCEVVFVEKYRDQPLFWEICACLAAWAYSFYAFLDVKEGPYDTEAPGPRSGQWNQADAIFLSPSVRQRLDG